MTQLAVKPAVGRSRNKPVPRDRRRRYGGRTTPYLFIAPAVGCLLAFAILPIVLAAVVSLTDLNVGGLGNLSTVHFVGLRNYQALFGSSDFWSALGNTALFVVMGVPVIIVASLAVTIGPNQSQSRFFRALRTFYFLPAVTAVVAIALIWGYLYNSQFGLLNTLLQQWACRSSSGCQIRG